MQNDSVGHRLSDRLKFNNLKISQKTTLAVSLFLCLMVSMMAYTDSQLQQVKTLSEASFKQRLPLTFHMLDMVDDLDRATNSINLYLLTSDRIYKNNYQTIIKHLDADFNTLVQQQGMLVSSVNFRDIQNTYGRFKRLMRQVIAIHDNERRNKPGLALAEDRLNPVTIEFNGLINQMLKTSQEQIEAAEVNQHESNLLREQLINIRYYRNRFINDLRLYFYSRSEAVKKNIYLYKNQLDRLILELKSSSINSDIIFAADVSRLVALHNKTNKVFPKIMSIYKSEKWRMDIYTLNKKALPALSGLQREMDRIVSDQVVQAGNDGEIMLKDIQAIHNFNAVFIVIGLLSGGIGILFLSRHLTKRLGHLSTVSDRIAEGDLAARVRDRSADEIGRLARSFDDMTRNLQQTLRTKDYLSDQLLNNANQLEFQKRALDEHAIVSIANKQGLITYPNNKFVQISGYSKSELVGQNHNMLNSSYHPRQFWVDMWHTIGQGKVWQGEIRNRNKQGEYYWVATTIVPFMDDDGRPEQYISIRTEITALYNTKENLRRQNAIMDAVSNSQSKFITETNPRQIFNNILQQYLDITASEFGFIGEIDSDEDSGMALTLKACSDITWDTESQAIYQKIENDELRFTTFDNLFGWVLKMGKAKISNDISIDPDSKGLPQGHPPIQSFMGIPLLTAEGLIGMIGLANRTDGYDEALLKDLEPLTVSCANLCDAIENRKLREKVEHELQLSNLELADRVKERTRELESEKEILQSLMMSTASMTGEKLFRVIAQGVVIALKLDYVIIVKINGSRPDVAETLAMFGDGGFMGNFSYPLRGSPCSSVTDDGIVSIQENVMQRYPEAREFIQLSVSGYIGIPFVDAQGKCIGYIAGMSKQPLQDISRLEKILNIFATMAAAELDRIVAQAALRESESRLRRSMEFANIGAWDWNVRTDELYWTESVPPLLGYRPDQLQASYANFFNAVYEGDRRTVEEEIANCLSGNDSFNIEHRVVWPDGSIRWLHESGDVERDESGKPLRMLGMVRDIDVSKKAQEQLGRLYKSKSEFLANMSHELRTPLNAIIGFSKAMLNGIDGPINEEQQESLSMIHNGGRHLLELIGDILDMSKLEAGKLVLKKRSIDIKSVIDEAYNIISIMAQEKGLTVDRGFPVDLPVIWADEVRIKQVLLNLLSNAVKFTEQGKISIKVELTDKTDENIPLFMREKLAHEIYIKLSVSDSGIGIPQEEIEHVFEEFRQVDGGSTKKQGGTGLGLAITRRFIEMHGGVIWLESEIDKGSTFSFILPFSQRDDTEIEHVEIKKSISL